MPTTKSCAVKDLALDLHNFRTVSQKNEIGAIRAMISINPEWFWALMESILEDGYHVTENILVLQGGKNAGSMVVKEGNRRIAALKLIFGNVRRSGLGLPSHIEETIANISSEWKAANQEVPCAVYQSRETDAVDKIVSLTHGKGEKAGRDKWKAVARARHSRDMSGADEFALDLLERYLKNGKNLTEQQRERWAGDYPLTVLEEALKRLAPRFGASSARELAEQYPKTIHFRGAVEDVLRDIGMETLGFSALRDTKEDFASTRYSLPAANAAAGASSASAASGSTSTHATSTAPGAASTGSPGTKASPSASSKTKAVAIDDPRSVIRELKRFTPLGNNRDKLVTLLEECRKLRLDVHPHAFCFLLRSMFEISAKAYCKDHAKAGGPSATKASGEDRFLVDVLRDVTTHLTKNNTDKAMTKALHGAMAEMAKATGFLSVTSLNQLIHNPRFSVKDTHISALFGNIFPLLEAMNS